MDWNNALRQRQGNIGKGVGQPSMGAGPVPYAPGSTQWKPDMAPATHVSTPQQQMPQGAGNGAPMAPETSSPTPPAGGAPGGAQPPQLDPSIALRYASYLMQRYMRAREQGTGYRG